MITEKQSSLFEEINNHYDYLHSLGKPPIPDDLDILELFYRDICNITLNEEEVMELSIVKDEGISSTIEYENGNGNLSLQEKQILKESILKGKKAIEILTHANQGLVNHIAERYRDVPLEDLLQAGNLGLYEGILRYDYTRGYKFSTYAGWWIQREMSREVSFNINFMKIPIEREIEIRKYNRAYSYLSSLFKRIPTVEEIANFMDKKTKWVNTIRDNIFLIQTLEEPIDPNHRLSFKDPLFSEPHSVEQFLLKKINEKTLIDIIEYLRPDWKEIISLRFGLNNGGQCYTLAKIGERLGVTGENIRVSEQRALFDIRRSLVKMLGEA